MARRLDRITVAVAADLWIAAGDAEGLERSTIKRYRELARLHIVPKFGELKLSQLTKAQVVEWRQELLIEKSRAMASKIIRGLSAILRNAMEIGAVSQNVASDVKVARAKREAKRVEPPARADLKAMIKTATDNERPFVLTAITMGLRSSELRGLCWQDIDLKAGTLTVRQRADEWGVLGPPKSEAGRRTIPMPPQLIVELTRWKLRCKPSVNGLVFPSAVGTPLRHNNVLRRIYFTLQIRAGLGVPKLNENGQPIVDEEGNPVLIGRYRFHALRHAAARAGSRARST